MHRPDGRQATCTQVGDMPELSGGPSEPADELRRPGMGVHSQPAPTHWDLLLCASHFPRGVQGSEQCGCPAGEAGSWATRPPSLLQEVLRDSPSPALASWCLSTDNYRTCRVPTLLRTTVQCHPHCRPRACLQCHHVARSWHRANTSSSPGKCPQRRGREQVGAALGWGGGHRDPTAGPV